MGQSDDEYMLELRQREVDALEDIARFLKQILQVMSDDYQVNLRRP